MIIIETCPECGHDLVDMMLASNPPISKKECLACGWSWTGEREEVVRIPFNGSGLAPDTTNYSACNNCPNNYENGGSGICNCTLGQQTIY